MRDCIECGQPFQPSGRELICSDECRVERRRRSGVERFRRWREQHVEEHRRRVRESDRANPEMKRACSRRRQQNVQAQRIGGPVTRRTVWGAGDGTCHYCARRLERDGGGWEWQVDHRIPLSRGGPHSLENTVVCCTACNMAKGTMTDVEFMENRRKKIAYEALENPGV